MYRKLHRIFIFSQLFFNFNNHTDCCMHVNNHKRSTGKPFCTKSEIYNVFCLFHMIDAIFSLSACFTFDFYWEFQFTQLIGTLSRDDDAANENRA